MSVKWNMHDILSLETVGFNVQDNGILLFKAGQGLWSMTGHFEVTLFNEFSRFYC